MLLPLRLLAVPATTVCAAAIETAAAAAAVIPRAAVVDAEVVGQIGGAARSVDGTETRVISEGRVTR